MKGTSGKKRKASCLTDATSPRISSSDAAALIQTQKDLLIVTADASGGGKVSGLACIMRWITKDCDDETRIVLGQLPWDESPPAECGAISIGLQQANGADFPFQPAVILILSDCEAALGFYDPTKKSSLRDTLVDAAAWTNSFQVLTAPTTSRGQGVAPTVYIAKVRSTHSKKSGFFDHEACDLLAMKARSPVLCETTTAFRPTPGLREQDMQWLKDSEDEKKTKKGGSQDRKMLCRERIVEELGFSMEYVY